MGGARSRGIFGFVAIFLLIALLEVGWSLSMPLGSGPDEGAHIVKAAAVVRGEWLGVHAAGLDVAEMAVSVPGTDARAASRAVFACYYKRPGRAASCGQPIRPSGRIVKATTYVGRYPPLYYLAVGAPSLFASSVVSLYLMRILNDLWNALALSIALFLIVRNGGGRLLAAGLLTCLSPMLLYLMGLVQPQGLETSVAILCWVAVVLLAKTAPGEPPPRSVIHAAGASACVLVLVRGLSPLWLAVIIVTALVLVPPETRRALVASRLARRWALALTGCAVLALAWIVGADALAIVPWREAQNPYAHDSTGAVLRVLVSKTPYYLQETLGVRMPEFSTPVRVRELVELVVPGLAVIGFVRGAARERVAIGLLLAVVVLAPFPISLLDGVQRNGLPWDGRYLLPVAVGVPLVAALAAAGRRARPPERRSSRPERASWAETACRLALPVVLGLVAAAVMADSQWWILRRYAVGVFGRHDLLALTSPRWHPVLPVPVLAVAVPLVSVVLCALALEIGRRSEQLRVAPAPDALHASTDAVT